jgi:hypothetical protein
VPLPSPILDDRSYQQLRDELIRRIPVYAPEWTDHNPSDPGVTLVELFAFLGENLLFRFNQIPETTRLEFLRLLRIPLRAATSARAMVAATTARPEGVVVPLGARVMAGKIDFETTAETTALPVELRGFAKATTSAPSDTESVAFATRAIDARGGLAPDEEPAYYEARAVPLDPQASDAIAVDFGATVDGMIWMAVIAGDGADKGKLADARLSVGFVPDEDVISMAEVDPCPGEGTATPPPPIVWQVSSGKLDPQGKPIYRALTHEGDSTRGLTQQGVARLPLPPDVTQFGVFPVVDVDALGTGDLPPVIEDEQIAAKVLFWLRAFRSDGSALPRVLWTGANAFEVVQRRKARLEFLGVGTGQPDQAFTLQHRPVVEGSLVVEVEGDQGWERWKEVDGFHASSEDDLHYTLDREAAVVRFGSVMQGAAPQIGRRVRATEYRWGGGPEGNVPAGAIKDLERDFDGADGIEGLSNPLPGRGGAPAEELARGLERIPTELRRRDRAVTRGDFKELALATPGADVGRAECLPLFDPDRPDERAAGVVTVVVWPRTDSKRADAPMPDRTLLRAVCAWLDARRLVTTELNVVPPTYRKVAVSVGVRAKEGYGIEALRRWVELVLRQYLAPLPPYGPGGEGWPLGRRVHGPELEAAALQVEGVEFLEGLRVAGWVPATGTWQEGTVTLRPWEVPHLTELTVIEGAPLVPGEPLGPPPAAKVPVPFPVIKEVC